MGKVISLDRWRAEKQKVRASKPPTDEQRARELIHVERMKFLNSIYGKQVELDKGRLNQ